MTNLHEVKRLAQRGEPGGYGPATTFVGTVLIAFAALLASAAVLPKDFALAAAASIFFALAAIVALVAWRVRQTADRTLTYWDVAGALTLFGICAATLMDSDQLVRLIESQRPVE